MNLQRFDRLYLRELLDDVHLDVVRRLARAHRDFTKIWSGTPVVLLDWLDGLHERGQFDPWTEQAPGGSWLPLGEFKHPALREAAGRALGRALCRWRRPRNDPPPPGTFLGRSRLLVVAKEAKAREEQSGAFVWLKVTAFRPPRGQRPEVAVAPWSFFDVVDDDKKTFTNLTEKGLRSALASVFDPREAERIDLAGVSFQLELSPLRPSDLDPEWGAKGPKEQNPWQYKVWELTPSRLALGGSSMGLPLGLAAAAALRGLCRSVIATGALEDNGSVSGVGDLQGKADGILTLLAHPAAARRHRCILVPQDDHPTARQFLPGVPGESVIGVSKLADAVRLSHFTDGFNDFRKYLLKCSQGLRPGADRLADSAGYRRGDPEAVLRGEGQWLTWLKGWLRGSARPGPESAFLRLVPVPFGAEPSLMAEHLERELSSVLADPEGGSGLHAADLPVIVRARLDELFDRDEPRAEDLPKGLLRLVQSRSESPECDDPHIDNALATEGKLVCVLHDDASSRLWDKDWASDPASARFKVAGLLDGLSRGQVGGHGWKPQVVLLVCSDLHHQTALLGALPSRRSA